MSDLSKLRIVYSPLSERILLARFGKRADLALDKRECEAEVMQAITEQMMHNAENGAHRTYWLNDREYMITVRPLKRTAAKAREAGE